MRLKEFGPMKMLATFDDALPSVMAPRLVPVSLLRAGISVAVVLSDGFSMLSLGSITDALSLAGRESHGSCVTTTLFSFSSVEVRSRSGVQITADRALTDTLDAAGVVKRFDVLFLCTGDTLSANEERAVLRLARSANLHGKLVCIIGAAIRAIAESGSISRCTDHWSRIAVLREMAPSVSVTNAIFHPDGHVISSPGELATLDYVIHLIRDKLGVDVANGVSSHLLLDAVRAGSRRQPGFAAHRFRGIPAILASAIDRIEADIEEPTTSNEIAAAIGISVRQLERLFVKYIGIPPQRYCRQAQLEHALKLLEQSSMDIVEISLACGFREVSTFNKRFKGAYGVTPTQFRLFGGL